jgi:hypothetical protein
MQLLSSASMIAVWRRMGQVESERRLWSGVQRGIQFHEPSTNDFHQPRGDTGTSCIKWRKSPPLKRRATADCHRLR